MAGDENERSDGQTIKRNNQKKKVSLLTFEERLTALDKQLDGGPLQEVLKKREKRTDAEARNRLDALHHVEDEHQAILQELGIALYHKRGSSAIISFDSLAVWMKKEEDATHGSVVAKIKHQQAWIIREQEEQLRLLAKQKDQKTGEPAE